MTHHAHHTTGPRLTPAKRPLAFMLGVVASLLLAGCGDRDKAPEAGKTESTASSPASAPKTVLDFGFSKDIRNLNPHLYLGEMAAQDMVFEGLTKNTPEGIAPALAESWELSPDARVYTFHLRHGVTFTDGASFNAEVVVKNVDAILANRSRHAWMDFVNLIDHHEAVDTYTWRLTLKKPYFPTLIELGLIRPFRFLSPNCFKDGGTVNGVTCLEGTGPWKLKDHQRNQVAHFVRNEHYWGTAPKLEAINWWVIPEAQTLLAALKKGEIQLVFGSDGDQLSADAMAALEKDSHFKTYYSQPIASRAVLLNATQPITGDQRVREAIQLAVNRPAIVTGLLNGKETEATTLFARNVPGCDIDLAPRLYNPKAAATLLDEAGWVLQSDGRRVKNGQPLAIRFFFNAQNAQEKAIALAIQADLKAVGIDLAVIGEEKQAFLDRMRTGDFDLLYSLSWGAPYDPQSYLSSWRQPSHGDYQAQRGLPDKAQIDAWIGEYMVEPDADARNAILGKILRRVHASAVYLPISFSRIKVAASENLQGVTFGASQYEIPFEKLSFKK